ncbi:MAG: Ssl1-like [Marteilia pararefringens]
MNNEDLGNSRFYYQHYAVERLCQQKFQLNFENRISLFDMSREQFLAHNVKAMPQILKAIHKMEAKSSPDLLYALNTGLLALKHRPDPNSRQRLVFFVGASAQISIEDQLEMLHLAKQIKRQKISIDIVNIGIESKSAEFLKEFVEAASNPESDLCSFFLFDHQEKLSEFNTSKVIRHHMSSSNSGNQNGGSGGGIDLDVDDPQLALALKLSLEDQMQEAKRQSSRDQKESKNEVAEEQKETKDGEEKTKDAKK